MTEHTSLSYTCSRCGEKNSSERYFCKKCGMGLALLQYPGTSEPLDVDVGSLLKAGIFGGLIGVCFSFLYLFFLQFLARTIPDQFNPLRFPLVFFLSAEIGMPLFFSLGSTLWIYIKARKIGLSVSFRRTVGGAFWALLLSLAMFWGSKILAITMITLLTPVLATRLGVGVLSPLWTRKKLMAFSIIVLFLSALLGMLRHFEHLQPVHSSKTISAMTEFDGKIYCVNGVGEFFKTDDAIETVTPLPYLVNSFLVRQLEVVSSEQIICWNSSLPGMTLLSPEGPKLFLSRRQILSVSVTPDFFLAATDKGCFSLSRQDLKVATLPPINPEVPFEEQPLVNDLKVHSDIQVAAVFNQGLFVRYRESNQWEKTTFPDPYPVSLVWRDGELVVTTARNVFIGSPDEDVWRSMRKGLPPVFDPASLRMDDGLRLYILSEGVLYTLLRNEDQWNSLVALPEVSPLGFLVRGDGTVLIAGKEGLYILQDDLQWHFTMILP